MKGRKELLVVGSSSFVVVEGGNYEIEGMKEEGYLVIGGVETEQAVGAFRCPVCFGEFEDGDVRVGPRPCEHVICVECAEQYFRHEV